jgi:hypothetical protein
VTGTVAVTNGGTGVTSLTSGALLKGNGTSAVAVASAADIVGQIGSTAVQNATTAANGGVTSVNGSTGAVTVSVPTFTATDAVGSVMVLAYSADLNVATNGKKQGDSISGSFLFRCTAGNNGGQSFTGVQIISQGILGVTSFAASPNAGVSLVNQTTAFNTQTFGPTGTATWSPCSGTWRALSSVMGARFDGYSTNNFPGVLCIRIA